MAVTLAESNERAQSVRDLLPKVFFAAAAVLLVVVVVMLLKPSKSTPTGKAAPGSSHYSDSKLNYSFDYQKDWQDVTSKVRLAAGQQGKPNLLGQIALGSFDDKVGLFSGVQVSVVQIDHDVKAENLDAELAQLDDLFQKFSASVAGRENDPQPGQLGGMDARQYVVQFVYHSGPVDEQIATAQTVTFQGNRQYTVNCQGLLDKFDT